MSPSATLGHRITTRHLSCRYCTNDEHHTRYGIAFSDGRRIQSTHIADLAIPCLRTAARAVRIMPGLQECNVLSLGQLGDAGYEVRLDKEWLTVWREHQCIFKRARCPTNGMCPPDVKQYKRERYQHQQSPHTHESMNRPSDKSIAELIQHTHTHYSFGSPPATRMEKAIKAGFIIHVPGLNIERYRKFAHAP
jgi:hypothetical protein